MEWLVSSVQKDFFLGLPLVMVLWSGILKNRVNILPKLITIIEIRSNCDIY